MNDAITVNPAVGFTRGGRYSDGKETCKQENRAFVHWLSIAMRTVSGPVTGRQKVPPSSHFQALEAVIHVEFDRMRRHSQARDVFHLEIDISVDQVIREHIARFEELTIFVQVDQGLLK